MRLFCMFVEQCLGKALEGIAHVKSAVEVLVIVIQVIRTIIECSANKPFAGEVFGMFQMYTDVSDDIYFVFSFFVVVFCPLCVQVAEFATSNER